MSMFYIFDLCEKNQSAILIIKISILTHYIDHYIQINKVKSAKT